MMWRAKWGWLQQVQQAEAERGRGRALCLLLSKTKIKTKNLNFYLAPVGKGRKGRGGREGREKRLVTSKDPAQTGDRQRREWEREEGELEQRQRARNGGK